MATTRCIGASVGTPSCLSLNSRLMLVHHTHIYMQQAAAIKISIAHGNLDTLKLVYLVDNYN